MKFATKDRKLLIILISIMHFYMFSLSNQLEVRQACKNMYLEENILHADCEDDQTDDDDISFVHSSIDINRFIGEGLKDGNFYKLIPNIYGNFIKDNIKCGIYGHDGVACIEHFTKNIYIGSFRELKFFVKNGRIFNQLDPNTEETIISGANQPADSSSSDLIQKDTKVSEKALEGAVDVNGLDKKEIKAISSSTTDFQQLSKSTTENNDKLSIKSTTTTANGNETVSKTNNDTNTNVTKDDNNQKPDNNQPNPEPKQDKLPTTNPKNDKSQGNPVNIAQLDDKPKIAENLLSGNNSSTANNLSIITDKIDKSKVEADVKASSKINLNHSTDFKKSNIASKIEEKAPLKSKETNLDEEKTGKKNFLKKN